MRGQFHFHSSPVPFSFFPHASLGLLNTSPLCWLGSLKSENGDWIEVPKGKGRGWRQKWTRGIPQTGMLTPWCPAERSRAMTSRYSDCTVAEKAGPMSLSGSATEAPPSEKSDRVGELGSTLMQSLLGGGQCRAQLTAGQPDLSWRGISCPLGSQFHDWDAAKSSAPPTYGFPRGLFCLYYEVSFMYSWEGPLEEEMATHSSIFA